MYVNTEAQIILKMAAMQFLEVLAEETNKMKETAVALTITSPQAQLTLSVPRSEFS